MPTPIERRVTPPYKVPRIFYKSPDSYPFLPTPQAQPLSTEQHYVHITSAVEALNRANALLPACTTQDQHNDILLKIAATAAEIGVHTHPTLLSVVYKPNEVNYSAWKNTDWFKIAKIAAWIGDADQAFAHAGNAAKFGHESRFHDIYPFYEVGHVLAQRGDDPTRFLDKAEEIADYLERLEREKSEGFLGLYATFFTDMAVNLQRYGRDPNPWLERARKMIEDSKPEDGRWAYGDLARAYARIGDIPQALETAKLINCSDDTKTKIERRKTLATIALFQFEAGDRDEALGSAQEVGALPTVAKIVTHWAYLIAKGGHSPVTLLLESIVATARLRFGDVFLLCPDSQMSEVYSVSARILAIAGQNPDAMFKQALLHADSKANFFPFVSYRRIIQDMTALGLDVSEVFEQMISSHLKSANSHAINEIWQIALDYGRLDYENRLMKALGRKRRNLKTDDERSNYNFWKTQFHIYKARTLGQAR